jgi:WD40 repeat protein
MSEVNLKLLTFSPDGRFVALAKQKEIINWWESKSGKHLCLILVNHYSYPSYSFSPDGNLLGVTTEEYSKNNEGLWDTQSCDLVYDFKENVDSITFSADGRLVAIVHEGLLSLFGMP